MYRKSTQGTRTIRAAARLALALFLLGHLSPVLASAATPDAVGLCTELLRAAARRMGWPLTISPCRDLPGYALQIAALSTEQGSDMRAAITLLSSSEEPDFLDGLESCGLARGLFHGWEAIIARSGNGIGAGDGLAAQAHVDPAWPRGTAPGLIAWRCGPYGFLAEDPAGRGREAEIAEALYADLERQEAFRLGSTVVILAETADTPGTTPLSHFQALAEETSNYYRLTSYGQVHFAFTFLDADGDAGPRDWYTVGAALSAYAGHPNDLAAAAIQAALAGADLPEVAYLERAIVIYAGEGSQSDSTRPLGSQASNLGPYQAIEVQRPQGKVRVYVHYLVLLSETNLVGIWAHELGHTLHCRHALQDHSAGLDDLYRDGPGSMQDADISIWDLMARGSRLGTMETNLPTHMSSYSKVAAGWLHYRPAELGRDQVLEALENQQVGANVLTVVQAAGDDPAGGGGPQTAPYYIIEARDASAPFGAPESGVMIYRVSRDQGAGRELVQSLCSENCGRAVLPGVEYQRPALHGVADPKGATEYTNAEAGFRVRLLAESFSPYRATVRIERCLP